LTLPRLDVFSQVDALLQDGPAKGFDESIRSSRSLKPGAREPPA
jgi:hypothetical protein